MSRGCVNFDSLYVTLWPDIPNWLTAADLKLENQNNNEHTQYIL